MLHLQYPKNEYRDLWENIMNEFMENKEKIIPYALYLKTDNYSDYLKMTDAFHIGNNIPEHLVSSTTYFLFNEKEDKILGAINIRHNLNNSLLMHGGHIGYGVAPSERRKGYATEMLSLALEKCREIGIKEALVTCDKGNIGSSKTIIKNHGILENELIEENGNIVQRYWIDIPVGFMKMEV